MTDEIAPQAQQNVVKKDDKKGPPADNGSGRGTKRTASQQKQGGGNPSGPRPSSRGSNKSTRKPNQKQTGATDSATESKKPEQKAKFQNQGGRGGNRAGGQKKQTGTDNRQASGLKAAQSPPVSDTTSSDAFTSLQNLITDMKAQQQPPTNTSPQANNIPVYNPNLQQASSLPPNAPVFQPGASAYPGLSAPEPPRHRKAASLGAHTTTPSNSLNSFAPRLGSMTEDAEDGHGHYEDGEIPEPAYTQPTHQPRSLSQSFTPPRFAALAQQDQAEQLGPTGRPQLAPHFSFGARRRASVNPPSIAPAIGEEDVGFQFPQQQQSYQPDPLPVEHKRTASGSEMNGIIAEQV